MSDTMCQQNCQGEESYNGKKDLAQQMEIISWYSYLFLESSALFACNAFCFKARVFSLCRIAESPPTHFDFHGWVIAE